MTVSELYKSFVSKLSQHYVSGEAENIISLLLEDMAGIDRQAIIKEPHKNIEPELQKKLDDAFEKLLKHQPVQYVVGSAWFYHMKFIVSPAVLIPRPETEELVDEAVKYLKTKANQHVIDIGTGSGCISISIKKNIATAVVTAIDVSLEALEIARQNAMTSNAIVNFLNIDFLQEKCWNDLPRFDVIISNPPYIPIAEKNMLDKNVTDYEPSQALFVNDESPLIFYEKIAAFATLHLKPGGKIFLEVHELFAEATAAIFSAEKYDTKILKDMQGKQRMIVATDRSR